MLAPDARTLAIIRSRFNYDVIFGDSDGRRSKNSLARATKKIEWLPRLSLTEACVAGAAACCSFASSRPLSRQPFHQPVCLLAGVSMINTRKIVKPEGKVVDEFEARVAQELFNIEVRACGPHTRSAACGRSRVSGRPFGDLPGASRLAWGAWLYAAAAATPHGSVACVCGRTAASCARRRAALVASRCALRSARSLGHG